MVAGLYEAWERFRRSEAGQSMSEYGLVLAIVAVGVIGALIGLRDQLKALFQSIASSLHG